MKIYKHKGKNFGCTCMCVFPNNINSNFWEMKIRKKELESFLILLTSSHMLYRPKAECLIVLVE